MWFGLQLCCSRRVLRVLNYYIYIVFAWGWRDFDCRAEFARISAMTPYPVTMAHHYDSPLWLITMTHHYGTRVPGLKAICYSLGSLTSIASSCFLFSPCSQIKRMFKETRWIASVIMLGMIAATLCAGIPGVMFNPKVNPDTNQCEHKKCGVGPQPAVCLLFVVIQMAAVCWYGLSYIPFARKLACGCMKKVVDI